MSRLRINNKILFSIDELGVNKIYSRNFDVDAADEITDDLSKGNSREFSLAANTAISAELAGLTSVKYIYIESDIAIVVTLNGGSDIPVSPFTNAAVDGEFLPGRFNVTTSGITSIGLRNPSLTVAANVTMVLGS